MRERWAAAFEEWAARHSVLITLIGVGMFSAIALAGLLGQGGESVTFSLITGAAVGITALVALLVASRVARRRVMFGLFGAGEHAPVDAGLGDYSSIDGGWVGGGGHGGH
jgi:hypothetical protein